MSGITFRFGQDSPRSPPPQYVLRSPRRTRHDVGGNLRSMWVVSAGGVRDLLERGRIGVLRIPIRGSAAPAGPGPGACGESGQQLFEADAVLVLVAAGHQDDAVGVARIVVESCTLM